MTRRRMSAAERREQLVDVGRVVFAERGFAATSVEEIADRAHVSKPIVYEHFGGKDGLYAVVVDREVQQLLGRLTEALHIPGTREAVEATAGAFLTYIEERPDGFRVLLRDAPAGGQPGLPTVIGGAVAQAENLLAEHLERRGYDEALAPLYAHALTGMVALVGQWWLEDRTMPKGAVAAHIVNLCWNGLRHLDREV